MPSVEKDDIITICCSGAVSYYRVLEPNTLLCDLISSRTGAKTGRRSNLEFNDFGFLDETKTATIKYWGKHIPQYHSVLESFRRLHEVEKCLNEQ